MTQEPKMTGTVEGTGSAINVKCGFKPRYVKLFNIDDGGSLMPMMEWHEGLADGYGIKWLIGTTYTTPSIASSGGITPYSGSDAAGEGQGFTIGTDSDINASGETILWLALR